MASELRVDKIIPSSGASIGIGTTNGTTTVVNNLSVGSSVTASAFYGDVTGNLTGNVTGNINNSTLLLQTGGSERLRITSGGNVDINGTPPWSVTGGDYRNLSISGQTASSSGFIWLGNGAAATNADFDLARINFNNGATITSSIRASTQTSANDDGRITFHTKATGGSLTEKLRITSGGKVNITPGGSLSGSHPPGDLNIVGTNFLTMTPNDNANASDNEVLGVVAFLPYAAGSIAAASAKIEAVAESGQSGSSNATSLRFYNKNSSAGPGNSGTERMRITSNANGTGALYVNQTSEVSGANAHIVVNNSIACVSGSNFRSMYMSGSGVLHWWNGSNQPYITTGGSFTNASDVSLKKDITDLTYGIDVLKNLKPRKYKMKADDKEQIGFIAQEVESVIPEVVDTSETPNGDEHKGLAYGNLTAVLTKALQEAVTKIETLEAKVAALEGS